MEGPAQGRARERESLWCVTYGSIGEIISGNIVERTEYKLKAPGFNLHSRAPSMKMQRWSTRWKTKRWPWDSAVIVLITLAILLQAAEVRGGKERDTLWPPLSPHVGEEIQGKAGAVRAPPLPGRGGTLRSRARGADPAEGPWGRGCPLGASPPTSSAAVGSVPLRGCAGRTGW